MKHTTLLIVLLVWAAQYSPAQTTYDPQKKYIWATAAEGGAYGWGTIVRGDSDGTNFTVVASFDSVNGAVPFGKMVMANNGKIYGVTQDGTFDDSCCIYCYNPDSNTLTAVFQFFLPQPGDTAIIPGSPAGGPILGYNGLLYGMTQYEIYSFDPVTNTYTSLVGPYDSSGNFIDSSNAQTMFIGELTAGSDGKLYGIAVNNSSATPFIFNIDLSTGIYSILYSFTSTYSFSNSYSGLTVPDLVQGPDNELYGMVNYESGSTGLPVGILYSYDISSEQMNPVYTFSSSDGLPVGGLTIAANGLIYGTLSDSANGNIFSYNVNNGAVTMVPFANTLYGASPAGLNAVDNYRLAGCTSSGGQYGMGEIYTVDLSQTFDSANAALFTDLFDFNNADGSIPEGYVLESNATLKVPSAIKHIPARSLKIFPNPAGDVLYINDATRDVPYNITDILGRVLGRGVFNDSYQALNISNLAPGVYLLNNVKFVKM